MRIAKRFNFSGLYGYGLQNLLIKTLNKVRTPCSLHYDRIEGSTLLKLKHKCY